MNHFRCLLFSQFVPKWKTSQSFCSHKGIGFCLIYEWDERAIEIHTHTMSECFLGRELIITLALCLCLRRFFVIFFDAVVYSRNQEHKHSHTQICILCTTNNHLGNIQIIQIHYGSMGKQTGSQYSRAVKKETHTPAIWYNDGQISVPALPKKKEENVK